MPQVAAILVMKVRTAFSSAPSKMDSKQRIAKHKKKLSNIKWRCVGNKITRKPRLRQTKEKLFAYDGSEIPVAGKCIIRIKPKGRKDYPVTLFIVPINVAPYSFLKSGKHMFQTQNLVH